MIRDWLAQHDIILAGRYSEWEYYNSDHAFIAGKKAAEQVKSLEDARRRWRAKAGSAATRSRERGVSVEPRSGRIIGVATRGPALQRHPDGLHVGVLLQRVGPRSRPKPLCL